MHKLIMRLRLLSCMAFIVMAGILFMFCPAPAVAVTAEITGAPSGVTNQTNPVISIGGYDVVSYRFKLDNGDYSEEIPVSTPINFSADVTIFGEKFIAGSRAFQEYLDYRTDYIESVTFNNVSVDSSVIYLLNPRRVSLQTYNTLFIEGTNIDELEVFMNNSPTVPAVILNQSLSGGSGYITYALTTDSPQTDFIRIINYSAGTASFRINLNEKMFTSDADVLNAINTMSAEFSNEPTERKAWRFVRDNRYHWTPLTDQSWGTTSPALFFNSVGFGFCNDSATLYYRLMIALGYQSRVWWLSGHVVPEVFVNNSWEMYDADMAVYYYNSQGAIAGVEELSAQPGLITNPVNALLNTAGNAYSSQVADIYASADNNNVRPSQYDDYLNNYLLSVDIPAGGRLDFPGVFSFPIHTTEYAEASSYTNARLTVPRGWAGSLRVPFVLHTLGYEGLHNLFVIGKDSGGNWQTEPTRATWTIDSWAPITVPSQDNTTGLVTLSVNKTATSHYTLDGSIPTVDSPVYSGPINVVSTPELRFFSTDAIGNIENVKSYNISTGIVSSDRLPITISADKISPQIKGSVIAFNALVPGLSGDVEYYFHLKNINTGKWRVIQPYSSASIFVWDTLGIDHGIYRLQVFARSVGAPTWCEAVSAYDFTINPLPATGVTLSMDKASPSETGVVIKFTGAASGGSGNYEYAFQLKDAVTRQWSTPQAYSSKATWTWDTTGLSAGVYVVQVLARSLGSTEQYEANQAISYTLNAPATGVTLSMDKASPREPGAVITFTGAASGGSGNYEYRFKLKNLSTGQWSAVQACSGNNVWTWDTTGLSAGAYMIQVLARSAGSSASYEAVENIIYTLNAPATGVTLSMDKASPSETGALITFSAAASGGSGSYEYYYTWKNPSTGMWSVGHAYSGSAMWTWDTTGLGAGAYMIQVWARSEGSTAEYEVFQTIMYTLNAPAG